MLNIISWIVAGLIVGGLARLIVPGRQPIGLVLTALLGVVGAFVGGMISSLIFGAPVGAPADADPAIMWPGWVMSVIGAVAVLWGYLSLTRADRADRGTVAGV